MKWFLNLPTRSKLLLGFGVVIALFIASSLIAYHTIGVIRESQQTLYRRDFTLGTGLRDLRSSLNHQQQLMLQMMLTGDRATQETIERELRTAGREADALFEEIVGLSREEGIDGRRLEHLDTLRKEFRKANEAQISLIYAGRTDEAKRLALGEQAERHERIRVLQLELGQAPEERATRLTAVSDQRARNAYQSFTAASVIALLLSVAMAYALSEAIANPLKNVSVVAARVAAGDLTVGASGSGRRDEMGSLLRLFDSMVENLRRTATDLAEGVTVLASSASEILASTTQVASGAAEASSAIAQTTSTVGEVKQTAQVSNQKAKHVSESAQKATQVAQTGRKAVEGSLEGMKRIQEQMESIAQSVVRLSEQGQAIGEIIATVNDLAEQSNLLAVNASIEAAKAGEQGKGFGVVAQEVKSLAEQSKQATAQVRALLNDIQKATTAAVLASEQGSKAVEAGVQQATHAGEAIRQLAESITEAAQAATQIAASSQQQLVGTDQVALAMENIRQASAQNVAGTKQAEVAAHNLHELGQKLKRIVERFKV